MVRGEPFLKRSLPCETGAWRTPAQGSEYLNR